MRACSFLFPMAIGVFILNFAAVNVPALPAFPGAEGFGSTTPGGRGGSVYHVTTLADSGAGSLRTGIATGNRTIVFDVSGTITLNSDLSVSKNNLTIAGQTAPGDGICIKGRTFFVSGARDVVVRFIRFRAGDYACGTGFEGDSFDFLNATNCVADHLTATWSIDECLSPTHSTNICIQWCMIAESLNNSCHSKGQHGYGSLIRYGNGGLSLHHNLYAHHASRNPRIGDNMHVDFVNNVVYNWGGTCGYNGADSADNLVNGGMYFTNFLNYVSNYFVAGPRTSSSIAFDSGTTNSSQCQIFQLGNRMDSNKNNAFDGTESGLGMFGSPFTQLASPMPAPPVTADPAQTALERVLCLAGASLVRDPADERVIRTARTQAGSLIDFINTSGFAGDYLTNTLPYTYTTNTTTGVITTNYYSYVGVNPWPTLNSITAPPDTDQDGIPNYFELALGWNPAVANNNHTNSDGYTDLEWYLNWLAAPHALCHRNGYLDVSLRKVVNVTNGFTFAVTGASNGVAGLLGDGFTARFVAPTNFNGLASFDLRATNTATGIGFPVSVALLVTTTNAPNTVAPTLAAISNRTVLAGAAVAFTNTAADADFPPQTLSFSLLNAPAGAGVNSSNGIFTWRPAISFSGTSNYLRTVVSDNGSPGLSATQAFAVLVTAPALPQAQGSAGSNGVFQLTVSGDAGPDYIVQASTNLSSWNALYTNPSPTLPFLWKDAASTNFVQRYYRIQLGP